jgi:dynein intermediate chain 2
MEDLKGPLLMTPYSPSYLSAAAWSPTRPGVFFLARHDGYLDIWDYHYRMNGVSLSQKISDHALTSMAVQSQGSLIAMGDSAGVITLLQLCDGLVQMQPNEKNIIGNIFDRETKREKNLEALKKAQKKDGGAGDKAEEDDMRHAVTIDEKAYVEIEDKFFAAVGMEGENLGTSAYLNKKGDV